MATTTTRRVAVLGASGNIGLATVRALRDAGHDVVGVARRIPDDDLGVQWVARDLTRDDVGPLLGEVDAVVHLAWLIQPSRDLSAQWSVNVDGFDRVLAAVRRAGVSTLVVASSVGAYSPRVDHQPVDETWPTHGVATSSYSRQKAYVERMLDAFEATSDARVVRIRPSLVFQPEAASEQRRLFAGSLVPNRLLEGDLLPVLPHLPGVAFQAVHADDVADAIHRCLTRPVEGAFNVAAPEELTTADVADLLGARPVTVPFRLARGAAHLAWRLRLHPLSPGWLDLARQAPLLDTSRARDELDWRPTHSGREALQAALSGMAAGTGAPTPTLYPDRSGREVVEELRTGQGAAYDRDPAASPAPRPASDS